MRMKTLTAIEFQPQDLKPLLHNLGATGRARMKSRCSAGEIRNNNIQDSPDGAVLEVRSIQLTYGMS